jgi:hypothetical protein
MKRWFVRLAWLALLAAAVFWGWGYFFPNPEHVIRKELVQLARVASIAPNEATLTRLSKTQKLLGFFADDAQISLDVPGRSIRTFRGHEDLQQVALGARSMLNSLKVDFVDVAVTVAPDKLSAVADLTATASLPGEKIPEVQELEFHFKKMDRDWLIQRVDFVKTLR